MICKSCGMESATADRCSLCGAVMEAAPKKPVAPAAPAPSRSHQAPAFARTSSRAARAPAPVMPVRPGARAPAPAPTPRVSALQTEIAEILSRQKAAAEAARLQEPDARVAQPEAVTQSPVAPEPVAVGEPVPALFTEAAAPAAIVVEAATEAAAPAQEATAGGEQAPAETPTLKEPIRFNTLPITARYALVFGAIMVAAAGLAFLAPHLYGVPLVAASFFGAMLLPVMQVIPWAEEDPDDSLLFIFLMFFLGPYAGLTAFLIIGIVRQTMNPGLVACFLVASGSLLAVQIGLGLYGYAGLGHGSLIAQSMPFLVSRIHAVEIVRRLTTDWAGVAAIAGWFSASSFRKLHE